MAFSAATAWEVRTTGSDSNGGGFQVGATGTDYSQQDSPQFTYTDLVIDATTNTKITSAAHPFDSNSPGNIINITGGTGFTVQRVQIVSVAGAVATCDKAVGTLSSTGGAGKLGGGLLTVQAASTLMVTSNTTWIKSGTYSGTVTTSTTGPITFTGYQTTHGDNGTRPLLTTSANTILFANNGTDNCFINNINFSSTAGTRNDCFNPNAGGANLSVRDAIIDGFRYASFGDNGARGFYAHAAWTNVEVKNCTTGGFLTVAVMVFTGCYIHGNTGSAISTSNATLVVNRSIITGNTKGIVTTTGNNLVVITNSTVASQTSNGIDLQTGTATNTTFIISNNVIYGNGGWGAIVQSLPETLINQNNAYGSNTSGDRSVLTAGTNDVALSDGPFTASGSGDYSLNSTAGGGTACKGAGFPGAFPGGSSTGTLDIGAVQSGSPTITFPPASDVYAGVDRGDGVTGTLHASNISTAAGHGVNLSAGILQSGSVVDDVTGSLSPGASIGFNPLGGPVA